MPSTSRHQLEKCTASASLNTHPEICPAPSVSMNRQPVVIAELAEELENLLAASPVDLKRVGDAVRAHPDFEALVLRLAVSLALSEDIPPATVEEAVVVLGTTRMRVLVHLWAMSQKDRLRRLDGWTPEILYLLSFLHWLGQREEDFAAGPVHAGDSTTNCFTAEYAAKTGHAASHLTLPEIAERLEAFRESVLSLRPALLRKRLLDLANILRNELAKD